MADNSLVTLRTDDGKWIRRVEKDDPVFSPLIPDLPDVREVALPSVISEIIMDEWNAYERLLAYISYMKSEYWRDKYMLSYPRYDSKKDYGEIPMDDYKMNFESNSMTSLLKGFSGMAVGNRGYPSLVYLHEVSRLSNLINFPQYWILYVGVDERTPEVERRRHIMTMGREYMEVGLSFNTRTAYPSMSQPTSLLLDNIDKWIDSVEKEGVNVIPWREVYWGLARNLLIRSWDNKGKDAVLDWTCVLWGDLVPLMTSYSSDDPKKSFAPDGGMARAARVLAGIGTYENPSVKGPDPHIKDSKMYIPIAHLDEYYHRLLLSFPDDVSPVAFGLEPILRMKATGGKIWQLTGKNTLGNTIHYLPIVNTIPWIHYNSLLLTSLRETRKQNNYHNGNSISGTIVLREDQFPSTVHRLANGLGKEGIRRILLSLLHYMDREGESTRVDKFTTLLEEELERSDLPESFQHLPRWRE